MKNIVGAPARGENFFERENEVQKLVDRISAGNNLQIAAPRRVGKTSILLYLLDNNVDGNIYVYVDTESVDTAQDFFKKILKETLRAEPIARSQRIRGLFEQGSRFLRKIKSISILGNSIDFNEEASPPDYHEELTNFLSGIELEDDRKLVLLIDEFPQTIINIVEANKGETHDAIQFLQANRELRLNPDVMEKVRFVYTGSIGLNHTVAAINASAFVNDLNTVEVEPLTAGEAHQLIQDLLLDKGITMEEDAKHYLLQKIAWLIPFHIQLAIQEIGSICSRNGHATSASVDSAFDNMIAARNYSHFEHYYSRLKSQFKAKTFDYAEAVLQAAAVNGSIGTGELYDTAVRFSVQDQYRQIIGALAYDGYINNNGTNHSYQFNSPVVRQWWQKFICK